MLSRSRELTEKLTTKSRQALQERDAAVEEKKQVTWSGGCLGLLSVLGSEVSPLSPARPLQSFVLSLLVPGDQLHFCSVAILEVCTLIRKEKLQ